MEGAQGFSNNKELQGIIPRSVEEIFNYIKNTANTSARFLVRASYLQIYNEVISDLLKPERTNLQVYASTGTVLQKRGQRYVSPTNE